MAEVFTRKKEKKTFFGQTESHGEIQDIDFASHSPETPILYYQHKNGRIWLGDSIAWLKSMEKSSVDMVFADPPYNIKKAEWDSFESHQDYIDWSLGWIETASRVLKPHGTLYICGFSEILADLKAPAMKFFKGCRWIV